MGSIELLNRRKSSIFGNKQLLRLFHFLRDMDLLHHWSDKDTWMVHFCSVMHSIECHWRFLCLKFECSKCSRVLRWGKDIIRKKNPTYEMELYNILFIHHWKRQLFEHDLIDPTGVRLASYTELCELALPRRSAWRSEDSISARTHLRVLAGCNESRSWQLSLSGWKRALPLSPSGFHIL